MCTQSNYFFVLDEDLVENPVKTQDHMEPPVKFLHIKIRRLPRKVPCTSQEGHSQNVTLNS